MLTLQKIVMEDLTSLLLDSRGSTTVLAESFTFRKAIGGALDSQRTIEMTWDTILKTKICNFCVTNRFLLRLSRKIKFVLCPDQNPAVMMMINLAHIRQVGCKNSISLLT